jgi:hypothetical protein
MATKTCRHACATLAGACMYFIDGDLALLDAGELWAAAAAVALPTAFCASM